MAASSDVGGALDMLVEEIDREIEAVRASGASAFGAGNVAEAEAALERVKWLQTFREQASVLRAEWAAHESSGSARRRRGQAVIRRQDFGKLPRGARTPEERYYPFILQALADAGGSAPIGDVLRRVGEAMRDVLRDVDYQSLPSDPDTARWRNAAQWARRELVERGLMSGDSPRGIWEITDAGRRWLAEQA